MGWSMYEKVWESCSLQIPVNVDALFIPIDWGVMRLRDSNGALRR